MSRTEVIRRIRLLTDRLEETERDLRDAPDDSILVIGADAIRDELSRLGRQIDRR